MGHFLWQMWCGQLGATRRPVWCLAPLVPSRVERRLWLRATSANRACTLRELPEMELNRWGMAQVSDLAIRREDTGANTPPHLRGELTVSPFWLRKELTVRSTLWWL